VWRYQELSFEVALCLLLKLLFGIEKFESGTGHILLIGRLSIYLHLIFNSFRKMVWHVHAIWPHSICRSSICGQFVLLIEQLSMHQSARHHDFLHLRKAGLSMVLGLKSGKSTFCERERTPLFFAFKILSQDFHFICGIFCRVLALSTILFLLLFPSVCQG
jgi:hypothetical protein